MKLLPNLNPERLAPEVLATRLGPFGSWPKSGLPEGYFTDSCDALLPRFYQEQGYTVIAEALTPAEVEELCRETAELCRNRDEMIAGIDCAANTATDEEAMRRVLCVHFPHKLSQTMHRALAHPRITEVLTRIIGPNVKCMQSMLFVKASGKPGQAWHQDEDFIPTRDRSLTGAWIALDDATVENGCLWILPGSHRNGILWPQKFHFDSRFDCTRESYDFPWEDEDSTPVEVKAGSIVLFNGYLLHRSLPNRARNGFRRSLVNHYMSAESLLPWRKPDDKTNMAQTDYRDIVMVAGKDPYAYKGTAEVAAAFVRADGEGGCEDWNDKDQIKLAAEHARRVASAAKAI
jgi:phytanoyl-CoA hydroxylase